MTFARQLRVELAAGPMPLAAWMARCNAHYYATRDPLGSAGDFTTAPEISQMFGELIGAWLVDQWQQAGSPATARLVELGPGRGTLMADARRSMGAAGWHPAIAFVETSPVLRTAQSARCGDVAWFDRLDDVPDDAPLFLVANEFFDALPVRQIVRVDDGWHERVVGRAGDSFAAGVDRADASAAVPLPLAAAPPGSVVELCPAGSAVAAEIGARLGDRGGAALIVDYGHAGPVTGDTLQAVRGHAAADPFADPGEVDLTAHVDFTALAVAAAAGGTVRAWGPVGQGAFLRALGIRDRAAALQRLATPDQAAAIDAAVDRLTGEKAMGALFKVLALTPAGACAPGFT